MLLHWSSCIRIEIFLKGFCAYLFSFLSDFLYCKNLLFQKVKRALSLNVLRPVAVTNWP